MCALDRWQNKYPHLEKRKSTIHTKCSLQKVAVSKSRQGPHSEQPLLSHCPQQGLCYGSLFYYFFYLSLLLLILLFASPVVTGGCDMFTGGKSLLEVRVLWKWESSGSIFIHMSDDWCCFQIGCWPGISIHVHSVWSLHMDYFGLVQSMRTGFQEQLSQEYQTETASPFKT